MKKALDAFERWADSSPVGSADLSIFRILYALYILFSTLQLAWLSSLPGSLLVAPPGPIKWWFSEYPPQWFFVGLEGLLAVAAVSLLVGFWTRASSLAIGLSLLVGYGFWNSQGKVDHPVFLTLTALILAFSSWGDRFSVDAALRKSPRASANWPVRLLAVTFGLGLLTAAIAKTETGWLLFSSQQTQLDVASYVASAHNPNFLAVWLAELHLPHRLWEPFDWITVFLETAPFVTSILSWKWFKRSLALVAVFHGLVWMMLGIVFGINVLVYGAFVAWASLAGRVVPSGWRERIRSFRLPRWALWLIVALIIPVGLSLWPLYQTNGKDYVDEVVVTIGSVSGAVYLVVWIVRLILPGQRRSRRQTPRATRESA